MWSWTEIKTKPWLNIGDFFSDKGLEEARKTIEKGLDECAKGFKKEWNQMTEEEKCKNHYKVGADCSNCKTAALCWPSKGTLVKDIDYSVWNCPNCGCKTLRAKVVKGKKK